MAIDWAEVVRRALKYLFEGLAVGLACYLIPKKKMNMEEILMVAITAAAVFAVLDLYTPGIGAMARGGAGFALGSGVVGGIPIA